MVARPLWERKAVGSNPATPTTCAISSRDRVRDRLWGVSPLPLLCKLHARVSLLLEVLRAAIRRSRSGPGRIREVSHKETEP